MQLDNFMSAYPLVETLYGVEIEPEDFEEIALVGWEKIGSKHTRLYRYVGDASNGELELPCNVCHIESVTIPVEDSQITSNKQNFNNVEALFVEEYIENSKFNNNPFYQKGKLVKYKEGNRTLYFSRDYHHVSVLYHGVMMDDEDLPLINVKEAKAIATFAAYSAKLKEGIKKNDKNSLTVAQMLYSNWLRECNAARVSEHLSQNDMNSILDAKVRWDRKQYGKSLKPIL